MMDNQQVGSGVAVEILQDQNLSSSVDCGVAIEILQYQN
jgi:hypothetical protein